MRVLDVSSFYSDTCGGIKSYYRAKAHWLPTLGVEAHFVVPGRANGTEPFAGATLHRVRGPRMPGSGSYRLFPGVAGVRGILEEVRPHVVEIGSHYLLPLLLEKAGRAPLSHRTVGFFHSDFPDTYVEPALARAPGWVRRMATAGAWGLVRHHHRRYATTLVASRHLQHKLEQHGVPRVERVGLGVDADVFRPRTESTEERPPRFAYCGRFQSDKGFRLLLQMARALNASTGAELLLIGAGPMAPQATALANRHSWVRLIGYVDSRDRVAALLGTVDGLIVPGQYESFSLATVEAMACGVPVVAAHDGGAGELVLCSGGGLTFRSADGHAMLKQVEALLRRGRSERRAMGARGREYVLRHHTWEAVFRRIHGVYERLLRDA